MREEVDEKGAEGRGVLVRVLKYDGALYRSWRAQLMEQRGSLLVLDAVFEEEVRHAQLGLIRRGTVSVEFYWLDRWFNVFRFLDRDGSVRNFYCNVNMPPLFDGHALSYVDLDVDVLVAPDFSYEILDLEEFEMNARKYGYPEDVRARALLAVDELRALIETRQFPFDQGLMKR